MQDVTSAGVLTDASRTTPVFIRFSTVLGSRGSPDIVSDVRGFAVKFYTDEGNWDIVGNDIHVFLIQDAMKLSDVIHSGSESHPSSKEHRNLLTLLRAPARHRSPTSKDRAQQLLGLPIYAHRSYSYVHVGYE